MVKYNFSNTASSTPQAYYPAIKEMFAIIALSQPRLGITCSKLTMKTLKQSMKYV